MAQLFAAELALVLVLVLLLVQPVVGWVTVSPQGRVTIKAETQIGHWELPEEVGSSPVPLQTPPVPSDSQPVFRWIGASRSM